MPGVDFMEVVMSFEMRNFTVTNGLIFAVLIVLLTGCNKSEKPTISSFSSPDEAGNALLAAAKSGDQNGLLSIFGSDSKPVIFSGDSVQDKATVDAFVTAYGTMHRWRKMPDGAQVLLIGADNFAFPIPLKKNGSGQWFFDVVAGKDEILARRIGRNELAVIDVCGALADAQAEYFTQTPGDGNAQHYAL